MVGPTLTVKRAKAARANTIGAYYRLRPNIVDFHAALNEAGILYVSADVHAGWWKSSLVKNENGNKAWSPDFFKEWRCIE